MHWHWFFDADGEAKVFAQKKSISLCSAFSVWFAMAASSANSMSRTRISDTFVFTRRREMLNSLPSVRVCRYTPSDDDLKA